MQINEIDYKERHKLAGDIRALGKEKYIIGIDGMTGTGKTNLAHYLAGETTLESIHLDDYMSPDLESYYEAINFGQLKQRIKHLESRSFIIEGCCLLKILEFCKMKPNKMIYCKEMSQNNDLWHFERELEDYVMKGVADNMPKLHKEIYDYHVEFKPWEKAEYIYKIVR